MDNLTGPCELPESYYDALGEIVNCLGNAWLKLDEGGDFTAAAVLTMEARRLVCAALKVDGALPPEEETSIGRDSFKATLFTLVATADGASDGLKPLVNDDYAAACAWVKARGGRVLLALKVSLDSLCAGSTLRRLCPPPRSELN